MREREKEKGRDRECVCVCVLVREGVFVCIVFEFRTLEFNQSLISCMTE